MTTPIQNDRRATQVERVDLDVPCGPPAGTNEELLMQVIAMLDEQRSQSLDGRRAARDMQARAGRDRISEMREAATLRLGSAIVTGVGTAASAAGGSAGTLAEAGSSTDAAALGYFAAQADADAELHGMAEESARNAAADADDYVGDASRRMDRVMQKLDAILEAEIEAARAALRG